MIMWLKSIIQLIKEKGFFVPLVKLRFGLKKSSKKGIKSMFKFSVKSLEQLKTCDPDLQRLFNKVVEHMDCTIICGYRNKEDQEAAFFAGTTQLHFPNSKHNQLPSIAVDVMPYPIDWRDTTKIHHFAGYVKGIADSLNINILWGGDWNSFVDLPHYELIKPQFEDNEI